MSKYITVSGGAGRSKLYKLSKRTSRNFAALYPDFEHLNGDSQRWEEALVWLESWATFIDFVDCYCY